MLEQLLAADPATPLLLAALALATLISEDLACVAAGLLVGLGEVGFVAGTTACLLGIASGDLLLFLAGRLLGQPALDRWPLSALLPAERLDRGLEWFARHGRRAVLVTRFVPGSRLPTYFAAGLVGCPLPAFALWLVPAVSIWTPLLVAAAAVVGRPFVGWLERYQTAALPLLLAALALAATGRAALGLTTWRRRRLWVSRWRRLRRWEFWPLWILQLPTFLRVLWLGVRYRDPALFTAANPAIPAGGLVLESKSEILRALAAITPKVARFTTLPAAATPAQRVEAARRFGDREGLSYPVVLKPDIGERGEGVAVVRAPHQLAAYLEAARGDTILQEHVAGPELGIFYYRFPGDERGRIFSTTAKELPAVVGDGSRTLEELILADERAVCMAPLHLAQHRGRLSRTPAAGERVQLVELGNHCRGAVFSDGRRLLTPELERAIDEIGRRYHGFHFGRFDLRAASAEDLAAGRFRILELNGVASEATHIYQPGCGLLEAYRVLFRQWDLAFAIAAANVRRGARPTTLRELLRRLRRWRAGGARRRRRRDGELPGDPLPQPLRQHLPITVDDPLPPHPHRGPDPA